MRVRGAAGFLFLALWLGLPSAAAAQDSAKAAAFLGKGKAAMADEDWYGAAEAFLEAIAANPAFYEASAHLADCYFSLSEFDQALSWARKARALARGDAAAANREAAALTALGRLAEAEVVLKEVLAKEPNNREALFAQAEIDLARGKPLDAAERYREAARRQGDDRRALLSIALVLGSVGDYEGASSFARRAIAAHPDDYKVHYYAAYLDARAGRYAEAAALAERALDLKADHGPTRSLLASIRYRTGRWQDAVDLADACIRSDRGDARAWYVKGMALARLGRSAEARSILAGALSVAPGDEFVRAALEDALLEGTPAESPERGRAAAFHFRKAEDFRSRNYADQALYEYRRGLRLDPYSRERAAYADLLRAAGFPGRQLAELRFLQELGKGDLAVDDAVEAFDSLMADAVHRRWGVDPVALEARHWKVAVMAAESPPHAGRPDAGYVAARLVRDLLAHEGNIASVQAETRQDGFSSAFRAAREAGADYFLLVGAAEGDRDLSLSAGLYVARTGSKAASFSAYRTGDDRLRNASRRLIEQLAEALPFRARVVARKGSVALLDKGRADGVKAGDVFRIVKQGTASVLPEGIGLAYAEADASGAFEVTEVDESVSAGELRRSGFFDRIAVGDIAIAMPAEKEAAPSPGAKAAPSTKAPASAAAAKPEDPLSRGVDPELRDLIRRLR